MSDKPEDNSSELKDNLKALREKNTLLEEELQLQKTNWLYSHHLLLAICTGVIYGPIIGSMIYFIEYSLSLQPFYTGSFGSTLGLFIIFAIPSIAIMPFIPLLKAPNFAFNSLRIYLFSFWFFESLILYVDPFNRFATSYQGIERFNQIFPIVTFQCLFVAFSVIFVPQIAKYCGYRLVLNGSALSFEVEADSDTISKQLNLLEEDFNLILDRSSSGKNRFFFRKKYARKKAVLQVFLRQKEKKTDVVVTMHSIRNDIPMRTEHKEVRRIGKSLMKWLEVSGNLKVCETENETLIAEIVQESKKSFYRRPFALPSKTVVSQFLKEHWKDIALIITVVTMVLSWVFPFK